MATNKTFGFDDEELAKLQTLAEADRRSMQAQVKWLVDQAYEAYKLQKEAS